MFKRFDQQARDLKAKYGATVLLVKIIGRRWSYVRGERPDQVEASPPWRVRGNNDWGLMVYQHQALKLTEMEVRRCFFDDE